MVGKGFVLHQHFIVENCGDGVRLRAQLLSSKLPAVDVFFFVMIPDNALDVYTVLMMIRCVANLGAENQ